MELFLAPGEQSQHSAELAGCAGSSASHFPPFFSLMFGFEAVLLQERFFTFGLGSAVASPSSQGETSYI